MPRAEEGHAQGERALDLQVPGAEGGGRFVIWVVCVFFCAGGVHLFAWWCLFVRTSIEDLSTIDRKSMKSVKSVKEKH